MSTIHLSALVFTTLTAVVILFQLCLAAGAPWGKASMGGKYPGKHPPKMRVVAVVNVFILAGMAVVVLSRAGVILPSLMPFSKIAIWVVAYPSAQARHSCNDTLCILRA
ncbi:MAG: hypothetical protein ACK5XV_12760 [Flavobacteriales bacterium]|jgi:hypothetical protein